MGEKEIIDLVRNIASSCESSARMLPPIDQPKWVNVYVPEHFPSWLLANCRERAQERLRERIGCETIWLGWDGWEKFDAEGKKYLAVCIFKQ